MRLPCVATLVLAIGLPAAAQSVPIRLPHDDGQMAVCSSSSVAGLDPNGDGFLAVRTGPGTEYPKIGELHNGDVVFPCDARGDWVGILFDYPKRGQPVGPGGWVHGRWLNPLAG